MLDKNDLQAIAEMMDTKLKPIQKDITGIKQDITEIKERLTAVEEDTKVTRTAVNTILDWADDASIQVIPLFNRKAK